MSDSDSDPDRFTERVNELLNELEAWILSGVQDDQDAQARAFAVAFFCGAMVSNMERTGYSALALGIRRAMTLGEDAEPDKPPVYN